LLLPEPLLLLVLGLELLLVLEPEFEVLLGFELFIGFVFLLDPIFNLDLPLILDFLFGPGVLIPPDGPSYGAIELGRRPQIPADPGALLLSGFSGTHHTPDRVAGSAG
jgi:hypothetical protein